MKETINTACAARHTATAPRSVIHGNTTRPRSATWSHGLRTDLLVFVCHPKAGRIDGLLLASAARDLTPALRRLAVSNGVDPQAFQLLCATR